LAGKSLGSLGENNLKQEQTGKIAGKQHIHTEEKDKCRISNSEGTSEFM
jgi:hypothetical protein